MYVDILLHLRDVVTRKCPEKWEHFLFLLHDNAPAQQSDLLRTWKHWNIPYTLLTHLQLIFTCYLEWNQHWRDDVLCDDTDIMKNVTEELKWFFKKWLLGMLAAPLQLLSEVYSCTRGLFWSKYSLNNCTVVYFSEMKWFWKHSEDTFYTTE